MARSRRFATPVYALGAVFTLLLSGCIERELKPLNPCLVSGVTADVAITNIDKVDLLFVVDNSGSMREEQASLRLQFPKLIRTLTTGVRANGSTFPAAKNLHLGVVSSDMGLVGHVVDNCMGFGDDGVMRNTPSPEVRGCQPSYPRFLSYMAGTHDPEQTAVDFGCIASLGTEGCGFEQQLEAALKALWPSVDIDPATGAQWVDPMTGQPGNRIQFLGDAQGAGRLGHGDTHNAGFVRSDPSTGLSLVAIVVVTDEEDCSSADTRHFTLDPASEFADQPLNLRCFRNPENLYTIERYVRGFKALRPNHQDLVIFAAIAGVPQDMVGPEDYAALDWENDAQRDGFYASLLADTRMQETVDPNSLNERGGGNLIPSCRTYHPDGSDWTKAYPPRRLVQVAQGFGKNGTVHSICQEDLGPAIDAIIDVIADKLGSVCLPRPLVRNADGLVGCNVVWELPPPGAGAGLVPTQCQQEGFEWLLPPEAGRKRVSDRGGQVCRVAQMRVEGAVIEPTSTQTPEGTQTFSDGWYYDDFSQEERLKCQTETKQRIAFTPAAKPPTGVTIKLECLNETQTLAQNRTDIDLRTPQPKIGDRCDRVTRADGQVLTGDAACVVRLSNAELDHSMFCHPELNVCVKSCTTAAADCPPSWVCDTRLDTLAATTTPGVENGRAYCVNPTCGAGE